MPINHARRVIRRQPAAPSLDSDSDTLTNNQEDGPMATPEQSQPPREPPTPHHRRQRLASISDEEPPEFSASEVERSGDANYDENHEDIDDDASMSTDVNKIGMKSLKEIGNLASWTVSSWKPGNGIEQLRDEDINTFWQSDGPQPHYINIHFAKRVKVKRMRMYLDFESDESYTPTKITIMSGTGYHDLAEVTKLDLERPTGWIEVPFNLVHEDGELRTYIIQVVIVANHQNGKDSHIRGIQVYANEPTVKAPGEIPFTTKKMNVEMELR